MIIAVDGDVLSHWSNTGIVTYLMNLLEQFSNAESSHQFYVFVRNPPQELATLAANRPNLNIISPKGPGWFWKWLGVVFVVSPLGSGWFWKEMVSSLTNKRAGKVLLLVPVHRIPLIPGIPKIVVIQDLGFELFPDTFRRFQRHRMSWTTRWAVRRADRIIAASESTKRDLIRLYGCAPDRVQVVHHGYDSRTFDPSTVPPEATNAVLEKYGIRQPFFLHVGVLQPRKNIIRLVDSFIRVVNERRCFDAQLVIAGRTGWKFKEILRRARAEDAHGRVILTGPVQSDELPILYKSCLALVMPSLYEGFGLPVLEAMACGTPVACSRGSSLTEVADGAALGFDPYSVEEISGALLRLSAEPSLRQDLRERGFQQIARFSWQKTAQETLAVCDDLARQQG